MSQFSWRIGAVQELADILAIAELQHSKAAGTCTLYQLQQDGEESLAITVGQQQVLFIYPNHKKHPARRRIDTGAASDMDAGSPSSN